MFNRFFFFFLLEIPSDLAAALRGMRWTQSSPADPRLVARCSCSCEKVKDEAYMRKCVRLGSGLSPHSSLLFVGDSKPLVGAENR